MARFETPYNRREVPPHHEASRFPPRTQPTFPATLTDPSVESRSDVPAPMPPPGATSDSGAVEEPRADSLNQSEKPVRGSRKWNNAWARRSPNIVTNDNPPVALGIDAGSKTLKMVAFDANGDVVFASYHRHRSDVLTTLADSIHDFVWRYGDFELPTAITGSAGISLARALGIPFVQEVVATTTAVKSRYPDADCIIELGGEDAKITYLTGNVEQRMNATCAGGTGDFIDGIASMLGVRTREISKTALGSRRTYPIASRCAVFAQTDVRPLINAGASKADIAQSALDAVVRQTLGGLACGRPIQGKVIFLGGPLEHIPALVLTFRKKLGLTRETGVKPPDAHLFAAMGAVQAVLDAPVVDAPPVRLSELEGRVRGIDGLEDDAAHLPPLFEGETEIEAFRARHAGERLARGRLSDVEGPLFLGFDAGSTTVKYALVDESGALVASDYRDVEGNTFERARQMLEELLLVLEGGAYGACGGRNARIARAVVAGYGEDLLRAGLGFDSGVVETAAHLRAAQKFRPDASFVLDIGGQDMKALWLQDGQVVDAVLNEACSSGCGAFVQSSTKALMLEPVEFSRLALEARRPLDLGAKCTVFMTSRVRHAQKTGAPKGDIAAGIAYSVVNNVMTRIIGRNHSAPLGDAVVVQGGAFKSDAVLRAFEKVLGVEAVRPDCAHLMGAYGAALIARDEWAAAEADEKPASELVSLDVVRALKPKRRSMRCPGCDNACLLSVVEFGNGRRYVSGNRCERAHEAVFGEEAPVRTAVPNVVSLEQKLIASFGDVKLAGSRGQTTVGVMNAINAYENMPFWHTLFAQLGFSVVVPDEQGAARFADEASETIPSESVCHPAKATHARYAYLVNAGADFVFMPRYERGARCPVAAGYVDALADNVGRKRLVVPVLTGIKPHAIARREEDRQAMLEAVRAMAPAGDPIGEGEFDDALETALAAQDEFAGRVARATRKALDWAHADAGRRAVALAGRPYHVDPSIVHRIDEELARLGFAVVPIFGLGEQLGSSSAKGLWKPSKHLLRLVDYAARDPQVEIVFLRSFGCGYDAVALDEARDAAKKLGRPFTELKIDDIANTAHIRIRLRTLAYTSGLGFAPKNADQVLSLEETAGPDAKGSASSAPTPDLCSTAKALVERAVAAIEADGVPERLVVPFACKDCLTDALPFELAHLCACEPEIEVASWSQDGAFDAGRAGLEANAAERRGLLRGSESRASARGAEGQGDASLPKVGLLGNPLLVYSPELNEHIEDLVGKLGWQVVYPEPELVEVDDVRYLGQLERFRDQGVERVIYLQSFGCLKGHVQSRGALHELGRLFPSLPVTVIDYDPESSALNRENRIRLALSMEVQE